MKRKIIKQGHNTMTVTLPSEWVKRFNLGQSSEIDMIERDNGLFLTTEKVDDVKKIEIDISDMDIPTIWKYFMGIYREGYNEIVVKFNQEEKFDSAYKFFTSHAVDMKYGKKGRENNPMSIIQEVVNRFIGLEIVEHHRGYCVIRSLGDINSKEFDNSLRRVFLLLQEMMDEVYESIKKNDLSFLSHTHDIDINVDKFHDYCIRVLNMTGFKSSSKSNLLFSTLFILEMIGDEFKNISFHLIEDMKGKKLDNLLQMAKLTKDHFDKFYEFFYKYTKQRAIDMSSRDMEIYFYLPTIYKKDEKKINLLGKDELELLTHFRRVTRLINALVELRIEMEF